MVPWHMDLPKESSQLGGWLPQSKQVTEKRECEQGGSHSLLFHPSFRSDIHPSGCILLVRSK